MSKILLLVFALIAPLAAFGRLGETDVELVKRFGPPSGTSKHSISAQGRRFELGPTMSFRQDDWYIRCDLIDGRCVRIDYSKRGDWTEDQIRLVLNSNGQGARWSEITKPALMKIQRTWKRTDGSSARWQRSGMSLVWDAYNKAKAAAEERAKNEAKNKPKI